MAESLYLASRSARRKQLLDQIGIRYRVLDLEIDERPTDHEVPSDYVQRLALAKARAGHALIPPDDLRPVLGADTSVVLDGQLLGKADDVKAARVMLQRLRGQTHQVYTAQALVSAEREAVRLSCSTVHMRTFDDACLQRYLDSNDWQGKAGSYAIQGLAAMWVTHLEGSYSGVMGLALAPLAELLDEFSLHPLR